eukprot:333444_1
MDELLEAVDAKNDDDDEEKKESEANEILNKHLLLRYPIFLRYDEDDLIQCVFVYLNKDLKSQLSEYGLNAQANVITAPPQLNGPILLWNKSLIQQKIGPETFLNVLPNQAMLISIRCAYFSDVQPLMIPVCSSWSMKQVKNAFISECELNLFDNINEDDTKLSDDKLYLFKVNNVNLVTESNIIDKT